MIRLTKEQAKIYKQRWQHIERIQSRELKSASVSLKFKQLCWLMNSFYVRQPDKRRELEVDKVRRRWIKLRKNGKK